MRTRGLALATTLSAVLSVVCWAAWTATITETFDGTIDEKTAVNLTASNKGWDSEPLYSPDGKWIAYISQETPGYESDLRRLAVYDRAKKTTRYLTDRKVFDDWVDDMRWTKGGDAIVFQAERHGRNPLFRIELAGGKPEKLFEHGFIAGWELSPDAAELVYTERSIHEPTEVFKTRFPAATPERLTKDPVPDPFFTDETVGPDRVGRFSVFERGTIYWSPATGEYRADR
jgi:dipeptidyl aminopeptidase/acylaminoacyl peptidase